MSQPTHTALIVVDVQGDFLPPNGSLKVPGGLLVVPTINELLTSNEFKFDLVLVSQDYHPEGHISFASAHPGHKVYEDIELTDARGILGDQKLWPDHCVQGTPGTDIHPDLLKHLQPAKTKLLRKGWHKGVEAYSAFDGYLTDLDNPAAPPEELDPQTARKIVEFLRSKDITKVVVVGLAGDYCVAHTALSAVASRFDTAVLVPATRAIDEREADEGWDKLQAVGASIIGRRGHAKARWEDDLKAFIAK